MKQLNPRWYKTTIQEEAAWWENFDTQFAIVAASLGFRGNETATVAADAAVVVKLATVSVQLKAYRRAVTQYQNTILTGAIGSATPAFPALPTYGEAAPVPTGIYARLNNLVTAIRISPGYNEEIAALLGILPSSRPLPPVDDLQPVVKMTAMPGSTMQVTFTRGNTAGVLVQTKLDKAETWDDAGRYYSSPAEIVVPKNAAGLPRSVQVRARYVEGRGNLLVGQFSDVVSAATQPEI